MDVQGNNLNQVDEETLALTANRLTEINLSQTNLSGPQCKELFKKMHEFTQLRILKITDVDLSPVPANVLAEAVNKV